MKRDMELVRMILLILADHEEEYMEQPEVICCALRKFPNLADETLVAHVRMMQEGGLVEAKICQYIGEKDHFRRLRLTWDGHEFIADARKEDVWKKAKDRFGDTSFTVFKQGLVEIVKQLTLKASN